MGPNNRSPEITTEIPAGTASPDIVTVSREPRGTRRWTLGAGATAALFAALTGTLPARAQEQPAGLPATGMGPGPNPDNPAIGLSAVEQLIVANTVSLGSQEYMMNDHPIRINMRVGKEARYRLGLEGTSPNNPSSTPGLPEMPTDAINQMLARVETVAKPYKEITFVALAPGDTLVDEMPNHNYGNGTSYNEYEGEPTVSSGKFGANPEGDRLTFVWRDNGKTDLRDPNNLRKVRKSVGTSLVTALIDGGEDHFLSTTMTSEQNSIRWHLARDILTGALPSPVAILPR